MKIASVGFWHLHGKDYAAAARANPQVDLVAVWDPDPARGRMAADDFGMEFVSELTEILADDSIEGVIVCTATVDHLDIVSRCLSAKKHVFVEKVLGTTLADAQTLAALAHEQDVALVVSLWRSDRGYARQIASLVSAGAIGEVTSARVRDGHPFALSTPENPDGVLPETFYNVAEAAGGILIDLCHPLYLVAQIVGYPSSVSGMFGAVSHHAVEDNAVVTFEYPSGALAIAETSSVTWISPFSIEVHGTEGSILYSEPGIGALVAQRNGVPAFGPEPDDHARLRIRSLTDSTRSWVELAVEPDTPMAFDQWVQHCQDGTRAPENVELAVALSGIVEAAYLSAAEHRVVPTRPLT